MTSFGIAIMARLPFLTLAFVLLLAVGCGKPIPNAGPIVEPVVNVPVPVIDLLTARKDFQTKVKLHPDFKRAGPLETDPTKHYVMIKYPTPAGALSAYLSSDPCDGKKHPAVIWAHCRYGGITGDLLWGKEDEWHYESGAVFSKRDIVLMTPTWRGENDNPGMFEMFYGEVEDLLAARDYVANLPYVDPRRIYLVGYDMGGTLTLLAATTSDSFRAAFAIGGMPDITRYLAKNTSDKVIPFDRGNEQESYYRSAINFVRSIKRPTFHFEGCHFGYDDRYCPGAEAMATAAKQAGVPFEAFGLSWGDHFNIVHPTKRRIADKIVADTGPTCNINFTNAELNSR